MLMQHGQLRESLDYFNRVQALDAAHTGVQLAAADALQILGHVENAKEVLAQLLEREPRTLQLFLLSLGLHGKQGKFRVQRPIWKRFSAFIQNTQSQQWNTDVCNVCSANGKRDWLN